ncbi:L-lysine permease [Lactiplantibacillus plantarum]|nr:L-lysine permease [Lactiplantibacillus plantarum]MCG0674422.1 L-lysine permease [Lactiplantibacillus plantarum]MCG0782862.1 L-lysine permease [Lactiplantibacillus plantarum]MCG0810215.1 L-lysine permease [Lactiplantibacillus plantarum]MCG0863034.1 L-lysine permease [Lactiplantibacillus plantarum]
MQVFLQGLLFGIVYIAPIGMQNLFVVSTAIEQPLQRALRVALIVIAFDTSLSLACFYGVGRLLQTTPWLELGVLLIGSLLVFYMAGICCGKRPRQWGPSTRTFHIKQRF